AVGPISQPQISQPLPPRRRTIRGLQQNGRSPLLQETANLVMTGQRNTAAARHAEPILTATPQRQPHPLRKVGRHLHCRSRRASEEPARDRLFQQCPLATDPEPAAGQAPRQIRDHFLVGSYHETDEPILRQPLPAGKAPTNRHLASPLRGLASSNRLAVDRHWPRSFRRLPCCHHPVESSPLSARRLRRPLQPPRSHLRTSARGRP